jgi:sulfate adenylyltransferase subunit 2
VIDSGRAVEETGPGASRNPKNQRPELWNLYNRCVRKGDHVRVFPLSNWTELDVWRYIGAERLEVPRIYFAHPRRVIDRAGTLRGLTGVDDPYEPPRDPDLVLDGTRAITEGVAALESLLGERGLL